MKTIVGIFAHPDDEALGPSGTIALLAKENPFYLICVTNGDSAKGKPDAKLAELRKKELEKSAAILGVKKVFFLDFGDGTLSNNLYHAVAEKIKEVLDSLKPELLLTVENRGVSGHLDHIAVSMITSFLFERLKYVKEIWYHCITENKAAFRKHYFIFFPKGYKKSEVDKIVNTKSVWNIKRRAMLAHKSQIKDVLAILAIETISPKEEYFFVRNK